MKWNKNGRKTSERAAHWAGRYQSIRDGLNDKSHDVAWFKLLAEHRDAPENLKMSRNGLMFVKRKARETYEDGCTNA